MATGFNMPDGCTNHDIPGFDPVVEDYYDYYDDSDEDEKESEQ